MKTIKSKKEFETVFSNGKRYSHRLVRITVLSANKGGLQKVAFVAPKRLGNAVFRNRCKRVLRAAAYECGLPAENAAVILFATKATHDATSYQVADALKQLMQKAGVGCDSHK
ncbi:MAG: ribonuclease P protein component [Atopobiaceae bacterium]|jgi:ribonuclease P protein component